MRTSINRHYDWWLPPLLAACLVGSSHANAEAWEYSIHGEATAEAWYFPSDPQDPRQEDEVLSTSVKLDMQWANAEAGRRVTFVPFARWDSADSERTQADVRELNLLLEYSESDLLLGIGKVFWGTTESVHWVDVINQTDLVEDLTQETKLGQPMINYNRYTDHGHFSFFALPGFRERTFPGAHGRLRTLPRVVPDEASYASSREDRHVDLAMRWSNTVGDLDIGLSWFRGTVREPVYNVEVRADGETVLIPHYDIVDQLGLDGVWLKGDLLIKFEVMSRHGQGDEDFFRLAAGPEYTFWGAFGSRADIDVFAEFLYDSQGQNDINPFERDIAYGLRLRLNDLHDTTAQLAAITDLEDAGTFISFEGSRRVGESWKLHTEARVFTGIPDDEFPLNGMRRDHHLRFIAEYRF